MSVIAKSGISLYKQENANERTPAVAFSNLQFAHKAAAGETLIDFNSLTQPDPSEWAYANPSAAQLTAAEIQTTQKNVLLFSQARGWLAPGASFKVTSNNTIVFTESFGETLEDEVFVGYLLNVARTGTLVADTDFILVTGTLSAGSTDINVGKSFPANYNPNEQVGWVGLSIDGQQLRRNVGNATASPTASGDYEEVDNGTGNSTLLRLNETFSEDVTWIVFSTAVATIRPDGSVKDEVERQAGVIDTIVETVAVLAGVPEANFQAVPTQPVLKQFGDDLLAVKRYRVATVDFSVRAGHDKVLVDTAAVGPVTATLPASPDIGDVAEFWDAEGSFSSASFTVDFNGNSFEGVAIGTLVTSTDNWRFRFVFVGGGRGWIGADLT